MRAKRERREYTDDERQKILDYVVEKKEYDRLKGRSFWEEMERAAPVDRSWQSAKEHFHQYIVAYLGRFKVSDEVAKILRAQSLTIKKRDRNLRFGDDSSNRTDKTKRQRIKVFSESSESESTNIEQSLVQVPYKHKPAFSKQQLSQKGKQKKPVPIGLSSDSSESETDLHKPGCSKQQLSRKRKQKRSMCLDFSTESSESDPTNIEQTIQHPYKHKPAFSKQQLSQKGKLKKTVTIDLCSDSSETTNIEQTIQQQPKPSSPKQQLPSRKKQNIDQESTEETADLRLLTCQKVLNRMIKSKRNLKDCKNFVEVVLPVGDNIESLNLFNFLLTENENELEDWEMVVGLFDAVTEDRSSEELMKMLSLSSTPPPVNDTVSDILPCLSCIDLAETESPDVNVTYSQVLSPVTHGQLNITNIIGRMMEKDMWKSDSDSDF